MLKPLADNADYIFAATQVVMTLSVAAAIYGQFRSRSCTVPLTTSAVTAVGLAVLSATFLALGLAVSACSSGAAALLWAVVAGQRIRYPSYTEAAK